MCAIAPHRGLLFPQERHVAARLRRVWGSAGTARGRPSHVQRRRCAVRSRWWHAAARDGAKSVDAGRATLMVRREGLGEMHLLLLVGIRVEGGLRARGKYIRRCRPRPAVGVGGVARRVHQRRRGPAGILSVRHGLGRPPVRHGGCEHGRTRKSRVGARSGRAFFMRVQKRSVGVRRDAVG